MPQMNSTPSTRWAADADDFFSAVYNGFGHGRRSSELFQLFGDGSHDGFVGSPAQILNVRIEFVGEEIDALGYKRIETIDGRVTFEGTFEDAPISVTNTEFGMSSNGTGAFLLGEAELVIEVKDYEGEFTNIETLIEAKGFAECVAVIKDDSASIVVKSDGLQAAQISQINEIVYEQSGISPVNVKIIQR